MSTSMRRYAGCALFTLLVLGCEKQAPPGETTPSATPSETAVASAVAAGPATPASSSAALTPARCGVAGPIAAKRIGPSELEISRAELERAVTAVERYVSSGTKTAHLAPSLARDGRKGVRVFGIDPNATCGLELGDLVLAIDGVAVTNGAALKATRDTLRRAERFVLEIERRGEPTSLTYRVR